MPALKKTKRQQVAADIKCLFKTGLFKKGWTQAHLAELLHKSPAMVSLAFNDPFKRDFGVIWEIAEKLDVNLAEALGGGNI